MESASFVVDAHRTRLRWKLIASASQDPKVEAGLRTSTGTGLLRQYGADPDVSIAPHNIYLEKSSHDRILAALGRRTLRKASRLPIDIEVRPGIHGRLNATIRWYPPRIYCITIDLDQISAEALSVSSLVTLQTVSVVREIGDLILNELERFMGHGVERRSILPGLLLDGPFTSQSFHGEVVGHLSDLVAIAIRAEAPSLLTDELVAMFLEKNAPLNRKSTEELLLVDKQGVVLVLSSGEHRPNHNFRKVLDLAEIALVLAAFLDDVPSLRRDHPEYCAFMMDRVRSWIEEPKTHLRSTISYGLVLDLLISEMRLDPQIARHDALMSAPPPAQATRTTLPSEWWKDPNFYRTIGDLTAQSLNLDFAFISDPALRSILARDLKEALRCRDAGSFKAAMVLAGSVIEAALLDGLVAANPADAARFRRLMMGEIVNEARAAGVLPAEPAVEGAITGLQDYRNLIHPGKEVRTTITPTRERANLAIAAMEMTIGVLASRAGA